MAGAYPPMFVHIVPPQKWDPLAGAKTRFNIYPFCLESDHFEKPCVSGCCPGWSLSRSSHSQLDVRQYRIYRSFVRTIPDRQALDPITCHIFRKEAIASTRCIVYFGHLSGQPRRAIVSPGKGAHVQKHGGSRLDAVHRHSFTPDR